jgi:hypothetical protein
VCGVRACVRESDDRGSMYPQNASNTAHAQECKDPEEESTSTMNHCESLKSVSMGSIIVHQQRPKLNSPSPKC